MKFQMNFYVAPRYSVFKNMDKIDTGGTTLENRLHKAGTNESDDHFFILFLEKHLKMQDMV